MFTLVWHLGIPDCTMSYSLLICQGLPIHPYLEVTGWRYREQAGDDHCSHTVILLRQWNSETWSTLFSWLGWALVVKEYELDRDRESNIAEQKASLPESGKWGLFLLPALSRHITQWSKWKTFHSSLGQEAGFTPPLSRQVHSNKPLCYLNPAKC